MEREFLQEQLAAGKSVEQIGRELGKHPSTVSYWLKKHGLAAPNAAKYAPRGGIARERIEAMVPRGMTTAAIARECGVSYSTARYWIKRYGMSTRRRHAADPRTAPRLVQGSCRKHGSVTFVLEGRGYYRCTRCRMDQVAKRRRKVKAILVEEAGGRCVLCGYDTHVAALQFHHLDPASKAFALSDSGVTRSLETLREEARKCVLLCANCHACVEVGALSLPSAPRAGFEPAWPD